VGRVITTAVGEGESDVGVEKAISYQYLSGIHLKITGLACYKIKDRMAWYERSTR